MDGVSEFVDVVEFTIVNVVEFVTGFDNDDMDDVVIVSVDEKTLLFEELFVVVVVIVEDFVVELIVAVDTGSAVVVVGRVALVVVVKVTFASGVAEVVEEFAEMVDEVWTADMVFSVDEEVNSAEVPLTW